MLGVVQEQHAERAMLYKQWKQYDFPIVQDATTSLNLRAVAIPLFIDEYGIVRNTRPRPSDLARFVKQDFKKGSTKAAEAELDEFEKLIAQGNLYLHDVKQRNVEKAIKTFSQAVESEPGSGKAKFSLGVAHRMRFDSPQAKDGDFETASRLWSEALASNPNQYIWRRRIEQYGPRLGKPYPFYDWVDNAIADIKKRGENPVKLSVNLTGSELAGPARTFTSNNDHKNPDPDSKIIQAEAEQLQLAASTVPAKVVPGAVTRVHLNLNVLKGKWNHEAGPLTVWVDDSSNGTPEKRLMEFAYDSMVSPGSGRNIDFEFKTAADTDSHAVSGFVLMHLCDDEGVCFYYRKNFKIDVGVIQN